MGLLCSRHKHSKQANTEENVQAVEIERRIEQETKAEKHIQKLLLLGAGESGKSTIFKQIKLLFQTKFDDRELQSYTSVIHANVYRTIKVLCIVWITWRKISIDHYLFDFPGQVELFFLHSNAKNVIMTLLKKIDLRISIFIFTRMWKIYLIYNTILIKIPRSSKFRKLTKELCQVIEDFSLVNFSTLAIQDKESVTSLVKLIDRTNGYIFQGIDASAVEFRKIAIAPTEAICMKLKELAQKRKNVDKNEKSMPPFTFSL